MSTKYPDHIAALLEQLKASDAFRSLDLAREISASVQAAMANEGAFADAVRQQRELLSQVPLPPDPVDLGPAFKNVRDDLAKIQALGAQSSSPISDQIRQLQDQLKDLERKVGAATQLSRLSKP